ncbi:Uncharacterised protein [Staphylococcus aureus]|nr:hypothetical protein [Staphylococcus aureus]UXV47991.1 hypothetical protein MUA24_02075 [Staphylococcus aureus]CAC5917917.1 Uncharacterised protein [Staphylococcus aureus]CAC5947269.1 Uncharacterised protein [Staphylococcus aureus]
MFDMKKIVEIAKKTGVEVNAQFIDNENGLYFRNKNNKLEKWDAISEFDLNKEISHRAQHVNNYFEKKFYINQVSKSMEPVYKTTNNLEDEFASDNKTTKQSLISEAA